MKRATKRVAAATVSALFGLAPAIGSACEYSDSMASNLPREEVAATPVPATTVVPKATVVKAPATKTVKQAPATVRETAPDAKVAAVTIK